MKVTGEKAKIIYLLILLIFVILVGAFWLDYIGVINITQTVRKNFKASEPKSVLETEGDEPSLVEREEFKKQQDTLNERIEQLDRREANIIQAETDIEKEKEKNNETRKGLEFEKEKIEKEKKLYSGYKVNIEDNAKKITSMRPEDAIQIMLGWDDPTVIDVLRQIDIDAKKEDRTSVSSYLISLMPKERASRILYLKTQI